MFWMDTTIEEVQEFIKLWKFLFNKLTGSKIFEKYYQEILKQRFKKSKDSVILNYKLFFKNIGLIDKNFNPTYLLEDIIRRDNIKLNEVIHYLILIEGKYIQLLNDIEDIQKDKSFIEKGNKSKILKEIKELRRSLNLKEKDYSLDKKKILLILKENGDEWFRVVICELFKRGYYNSLSSLLEALSRRFANNYFHNQLKTNFLLENFKPPVGYRINWKVINEILNKYKKVFSNDFFMSN